MGNIPPVPFGGGTPTNPFTAKPLPQAPMGGGMSGDKKPIPPRNGGINVEDLVKRIDAKIAELEEEEKKEKENASKQVASTTTAVDSKSTQNTEPSISKPSSQPSIPSKVQEQVSIPSVTPMSVNNTVVPSVPPVASSTETQANRTPGISDDQFFDDFFGDD